MCSGLIEINRRKVTVYKVVVINNKTKKIRSPFTGMSIKPGKVPIMRKQTLYVDRDRITNFLDELQYATKRKDGWHYEHINKPFRLTGGFNVKHIGSTAGFLKKEVAKDFIKSLKDFHLWSNGKTVSDKYTYAIAEVTLGGVIQKGYYYVSRRDHTVFTGTEILKVKIS